MSELKKKSAINQKLCTCCGGSHKLLVSLVLKGIFYTICQECLNDFEQG